MNNKLFARIAAAAVGVSMLSTFVFADEAANASLSSDKSQLTLNATAINTATGEDATQVTMMAYLVGANGSIETAYVDEEKTPMVALEQVAKGDVEKKLATINVLATKFTDAFPNAVIKTGHNGTVGAETGGVTWFISTVSTPEGKKITIMNGATAIDIDVVDGVATLPTDTKFDKKMNTTNVFSLYSWVALDAKGEQKAEYVIDKVKTVNVTDLEGVTLYAKFISKYKKGDMNEDHEINGLDLSPIQAKINNRPAVMQKNVDVELFDGYTKKGDMNGDGEINGLDLSPIQAKINNRPAIMQKNVDDYIYVINN